MKIIRHVLMPSVLIALTLLMTAFEPSKTSVSGLLDPGSYADRIATNNMDILINNYKEEWKYNRNGHTNEPPRLGLALCGGGMRAGSFSIGILAGLNQLGVLSNVDVISSVSGGGYAASWFYVQSMNNNFDENSLFCDEGKYQTYLTNHGELISHFSANHTRLRRSGYALRILENSATIPVNAFANGIFGWHANVVPGRRIYEEGIDRLFDVVPRDDGSRSSLDIVGFRDFSAFLNLPKHLTFPGIESSNIEGRLPFPIVNTTAHIDAAPPEENSLLQNRVFEFTPLHFGNDYFSYHTNNYPFDYNRAIAVSGGAFDSKQIHDPSESLLASIFNYDLGYSINNPDIGQNRYPFDPLPLPFYLFDGHYQKDINGDRIYLSDGGHSENLGAYSLIRRLCKTIIIIDDEYDETNDLFDAYKKLKKSLQMEMGVNFSVPNIDLGLCSQNTEDEPVMHGTISSFPLLSGTNNVVENRTINVVYVLLSINTNKLNFYPGVIKDYYTNTIGKKQWGQLSEFPRESTSDLSYNPKQVLAYHELGRYMITNYPKFFEDLGNPH